MTTPTETQLCNDLDAYCIRHRLPKMSADELIAEDIAPEHKTWLKEWLLLWSACIGVNPNFE